MKAKINVYSDEYLEEIMDIQKFLQEDTTIRYKGKYNTGVIHPRVLNLALNLLAGSKIIRSKVFCSICGSEINDGCPICDTPKALKSSFE